MKKLTMFIVLLAGAMSAYATTGETPEQFEPKRPTYVGRMDETGRVLMVWRGKTLTHAGTFRNLIGHSMQAIVEVFFYNDDRPITRAAFRRFMNNGYPTITWSKPQWISATAQRCFGYENGVMVLVSEYGATNDGIHKNRLGIWYESEYYYRLAKMAKRNGRETTLSTPRAPSTTPDKADCAVVASETFNRLKGKSAWVAIVSATVVYADGHSNGHAMAVWKNEPTSHVQIYVGEGIGTLSLNTTSEKPEDIENAFNATLDHNGVKDRFKDFTFTQDPVTPSTMGLIEKHDASTPPPMNQVAP